MWTKEHPTKPGVYWVSVGPKHRPPCHWEKSELPSVFRILITPTGDCWEIDWEKSEPTYNVENLTSSVRDLNVLYADACGEVPADPWEAPPKGTQE